MLTSDNANNYTTPFNHFLALSSQNIGWSKHEVGGAKSRYGLKWEFAFLYSNIKQITSFTHPLLLSGKSTEHRTSDMLQFCSHNKEDLF